MALRHGPVNNRSTLRALRLAFQIARSAMSDWVFLAAQRKSHSRTGFGATIGSRRSTGRKERVAHLHQLPPRGQ